MTTTAIVIVIVIILPANRIDELVRLLRERYSYGSSHGGDTGMGACMVGGMADVDVYIGGKGEVQA